MGLVLNLEVEVKFWQPNLASLRNRVVAAGGDLKKPRLFERNLVLDTADNRLRHNDQLLRLRQDTAVRLTFKGKSPDGTDSEARVVEELEVAVADFAAMAAILQRLGLKPSRVYEKYRETFQLEDIEIVLDELPFGNFVELEGPENAIKAAAKKLGLDWRQRIVTNYLSLMDQLIAHHDLPFTDLTFENFRGLSVSMAGILSLTNQA